MSAKKGNDTTRVADKMKELDVLLDWFSTDDFSLEEAVEKFRQADTLAKDIEATLGEMKNEITVLREQFDESR